VTALALAVLLGALAAPPARAVAGLPGSSWGVVSQDVDGLEGAGTQGFLQQGVDWVRLPYAGPLRTFGSYRWRFRTENERFFNMHAVAVGVEARPGPVSVGVEQVWRRFPELDRDTDDMAVYLSYYLAWKLGPRWPGSTWGRLSRDLSDVEGDGTMGYVEQGRDLASLPGGATLGASASMRWRLRTRNERFFNAFGPAFGFAVRRTPLRAGVEASWKRYPELSRTDRTLELYATWYLDWNLKRR